MPDHRTWEEIHAERDWGSCPSEHMVRFMRRTFDPRRQSGFDPILVFDVGCGSGANLEWLMRNGFIGFGIDVSASAVRRAVDRLGSSCALVGDLTAIMPEALTANRFHCVVDICCLQHVEALAPALAQIHRVLKPGGWLFSMAAAYGHSPELSPVPYMRILHARDVHSTYQPFEAVRVDRAGFTSTTDDGDCYDTRHWLVSARKAS